jgi:hypothetical protein
MTAGSDALKACFVLPAPAPKGQQIIAQGFNPGYGVLTRCALKEAPEFRAADRAIGSKICCLDPTRRTPLVRRFDPRTRRPDFATPGKDRPQHEKLCRAGCPRPRFRSNGAMESWSDGVMRQIRIAPAERIDAAFRVHRRGPKPRVRTLGCDLAPLWGRPFGTRPETDLPSRLLTCSTSLS